MADLNSENLTDAEQISAGRKNKRYQAQTSNAEEETPSPTEAETSTEGAVDVNNEKQVARDLSQEQRQALESQSRLGKEKADLSKETGAEKSLRGTIQEREAQKKAAEPKGQASMPGIGATGIADAVDMAGQQLTAKAMYWSWNTLCDFSFTILWLGLIYLNGHFIMKYIVGSTKFCDFGDEWTYDVKSKIPGWIQGSSTLKWAEIIALFLVDTLVFLLILMLLTALMMVISGYKLIFDLIIEAI